MSQEWHYYPFAVTLDRYVGSFNTLNDLSNKLWQEITENKFNKRFKSKCVQYDSSNKWIKSINKSCIMQM